MTDDVPGRAARAFERHDAFAPASDGFLVTTTRFEAVVTASDSGEWALRYDLTVRLPMLSAVTNDEVGAAVVAGWFETLERRLPDATMATRHDVELAAFDLTERGDEAVATFTFEFGNADRVPDVVTALVEYTEGTYMEGVVPGYDYRDPVASMLSRARQDDDRGPMPL